MKEMGVPLSDRLREFPWMLSDLIFPFMGEYLVSFSGRPSCSRRDNADDLSQLTWYLIWETILNTLAELTRFADRNFYGPWWNSGTLPSQPILLCRLTSLSILGPIRARLEQVRKPHLLTSRALLRTPSNRTSRPVHNFLLRHVYHSSISFMKVDKYTATLITFFLSACIHELIMWCLFKKLRGYLLMLQMCQLPVCPPPFPLVTHFLSLPASPANSRLDPLLPPLLLSSYTPHHHKSQFPYGDHRKSQG